MTNPSSENNQSENASVQPQEAAEPAPLEAEVVAPAAPQPSPVQPEVEVIAEPVTARPEPSGALEAARAEARQAREQMLRVAADFDNYRKRSRRELEDGARRAKEDLLRELLPVFDNLERAVVHAEQATDVGAVASGVKIVLKQFEDTASKLGVSRVPTVGTKFDPAVHEAIQQMESADQAPGTVVAEVMPGYVWGERLLRAAMVVVAKAPAVVKAPEEPSES